MNGPYTWTFFEVESERRREELTGSMQGGRQERRAVERYEHETAGPVAASRSHRHPGLVGLAIGLLARTGPRT